MGIIVGSEEIETLYHNLRELLPEDEIISLSSCRGYGEKLNALSRVTGKNKVLLIEKNVLEERFPPPESIREEILSLRIGENVFREQILSWLERCGYERTERIEIPGEWSVRGSIIDVFPPGEKNPLRIELEENKIISLRVFDTLTQRSLYQREEISLPSLKEKGKEESNILEYFEEGDFIILQDARTLREEFSQKGISWSEILHYLTIMRTLLVSWLPESPPFSVKETFSLPFQSLRGLSFSFSTLYSSLRRWEEEGYRIFISGLFNGEKEKFRQLLREKGIQRFEFLKENLKEGFISSFLKLVLLTPREIRGYQPVIREVQRGLPLLTPFSLEKGDYVVHRIHGIGKFLGLRVEKGREFLTIEYEGGDLLYVPIEGIHLVEKYIGIGDTPPPLNRLGGTRWRKTKERIKKAVRDLASEILHTQAWRLSRKGHAFSPDTPWQKEFETTFPYHLTPDQKRSIEEVKRDMEDYHPMDRLICGDTGFGKTEVAMRAAFKAVMDGKQVVILTPTTLLAHQHFINFRERMENFPIRIEVLSRFINRRKREKILQELREGKVDILIGTHLILSEEVVFKDLGLLIIDEEQRFGVRDKEKIKTLRKEVDVLTLTATPIPRTLYLALLGIRDISLIQTPPPERLDVEVEIREFSLNLIREAIQRELKRKGQVFFVHNHIPDLEGFEKLIHKLVPLARISVVHGKIPSRRLEKEMLRFIDKEIDVLITTTIIASGLDIPNANTIIINEAHRFGLADLYQLRGRVGRFKVKAYAYFLIPPRHTLSPQAKKRLYALEEFSRLGKGYQLALSDLEIRGAGNILGEEQHGHIQAVGLSLYTELLSRAIAEIKGESFLPFIPTQVELGLPSSLSIPYLTEGEKLEYYRKLSLARSVKEIEEIRKEIKDRFGELPPEVENLLHLHRIKILAYERGIEYIRYTDKKILLRFFPGIPLQEKAQKLHHHFPGRVLLTPQGEIGIKGEKNPALLYHLLHRLEKDNTKLRLFSASSC